MQYKRIVITKPGGPDNLQLVEDTLPEPLPDQVQVQVLAAGVAWGDLLLREGKTPGQKYPVTPGFDLVGIVAKCGRSVTTLSEGQMVATLPILGGYCESINLPADELVPLSDHNLDPAVVAAVPFNYLTAYQMLNRALTTKSVERILIHSGAGGIGTAMLQLAARRGITVYATASKPKHDLVRELGGIPIDYKTEDFVTRVKALTGDGVDVVYDQFGGRHLWRSYQTLRHGGQLICYGILSAAQGSLLNIPLTLAILAAASVMPGTSAVFFHTSSDKQQNRTDLMNILQLLSEGKIKPVIGARLPLGQASQAHRLLETAAVVGKIVLVTEGH